MPAQIRLLLVVGLLLAALVADAAHAARPAKKATPSTPSTPLTFSEVRKAAPSARVARRTAFVVFATSDRAALDERRLALQEATALADRDSEAAVHLTLQTQLAGLEDAAGEREAAHRILKRALAGGGAATKRLAWVQADDEAIAVFSALDFDDAFAAGRGPTLPSSLSAATKAWRERPAASKKATPPRGSTFGVRWSLADVVSDPTRGLQAAIDDSKVRAGLLKRLASLGAARGPRDTAALRARALEVRAALLLIDSRPADAALDLLRADRLRALDPLVDVAVLPPAQYAGLPRTRGLCLEQPGQPGQRGPAVSCDQLEEEKLGGVSFVDASRAPEHAFSAEEAQLVLADYDVLVLRCLKQGAKDNLTTQTVVQLEWGIGNDGLVKVHDLRPMRLRGAPASRPACRERGPGSASSATPARCSACGATSRSAGRSERAVGVVLTPRSAYGGGDGVGAGS